MTHCSVHLLRLPVGRGAYIHSHRLTTFPTASLPFSPSCHVRGPGVPASQQYGWVNPTHRLATRQHTSSIHFWRQEWDAAVDVGQHIRAMV